MDGATVLAILTAASGIALAFLGAGLSRRKGAPAGALEERPGGAGAPSEAPKLEAGGRSGRPSSAGLPAALVALGVALVAGAVVLALSRSTGADGRDPQHDSGRDARVAKNQDRDTPGPKDQEKPPDDKKPRDEQKSPQRAPGETLHVEVLGLDALRALGAPVPSGAELNDAGTRRVYRLRDQPDRLLTLGEVEKIAERKSPPVRYVTAVLYDDSPTPAHPWVKELLERIGDLPVRSDPDKKIVATTEAAPGRAPAPPE
jgi:hypothetical protein